jgi:hypothetical protein
MLTALCCIALLDSAPQSVKPLHDEMLHNLVFCLEQKNEVIVQMIAAYSWFIFELLIKSMVRYLYRQKFLFDEATRNQRFAPSFANVCACAIP